MNFLMTQTNQPDVVKKEQKKKPDKKQEHLDGPWEGQELHRKHPKSLKDADVDLHRTKQWLTSNGLKTVTEIERKNGKGFTEQIIEEWIINIRNSTVSERQCGKI